MIGNGLLASPKDAALGAALIVVLIFVFTALWLLTGLKKCPSDKILVVVANCQRTQTAVRKPRNACTAARCSSFLCCKSIIISI